MREREKIINELVDVGFMRYHKGFNYLVEAIYIIYKENILYRFRLAEIYLAVAEKYNVTYSSVKGAINYAVDTVLFDPENKDFLLTYTEVNNLSNISTKKLVEVIVDKLFSY